MAFNSTVGDANANSFCSVAEADAYMDTLAFRSLWPATGTNGTLKENALMQAARYIDLLAWKGRKVTLTQALTWPRYGVWDESGYAISWTIVPQQVKNAQCELALRLLADDRASEDARAAKRVKVGPIEAEFSEGMGPRVIPGVVYQLLGNLLAATGGVVRTLRA